MSEGRVTAIDTAALRGFLHEPEKASGAGLVLTHGAGSDCTAPLLVAVAAQFCASGFIVLRCDLAFRRKRPKGPPSPATAAADRAGLGDAVAALRERVSDKIYLGGHSYGGRQASMLAAEMPDIAAALLLLSYPLHPPNKPAQMRTQHFAQLRAPALFVSGTKDGFGTIAEIDAAREAIPATTRLIAIDGAGHDLKRGRFDLAPLPETLTQLR
ncbi:MAG TPA: alpha/beta fold hydrolase [Stellaceae bacterium]|nr:alpha/beta fold hydrolase [Stellaceae bacterium]